MAEKRSKIVLTTGREISVDGGVDLLNHHLQGYFADRVPPLMKITDAEGGVHLINVNEIAEVEGPE